LLAALLLVTARRLATLERTTAASVGAGPPPG